MLRKLACALFVVAMSVTLVSAEEFLAKITKIDGDKVTLAKGEKQGKKMVYGDAKEFKLAKDVKVLKGGKKGQPGEPLEGGLKAEVLTKIDAEKGVNARITTNADNMITEIQVLKKGGKKKNNQ